ncbi:MAG: caspase family protein [Candidatus Marinimicrobia bacterium]|nr:caspase family protein [Candidatus Neomarinimicrobiota bacterium]
MKRESFFLKFFILIFSIIVISPTAICQDSTKSFFDKAKGQFNNLLDKTVETVGSSIDKTFKNEITEESDSTIAKTVESILDEQQKKLTDLVEKLNSLEENINKELEETIQAEIDDSPIKDFESPQHYEERKSGNNQKIEELKLRFDQKFAEQKLLLENQIEAILSQTYRDSLKLELGRYINARERFAITDPATGQHGSLYVLREIAPQFKTDFTTLSSVGIYQLLDDGSRRLINVEITYKGEIYTSLFDRRLEKIDALKTLDAHSRNINIICFNNDGTKFATGSDDKTVKIWDAEKQTVILELPRFSSYITALSFHPCQQILVCGDNDGELAVWNIDTKTEVAKIKAHEERINSISFNPDGSKIVTGSKDKTAKVWQVPSMEMLYTLGDNTDEIKYALYNPDGVNLIIGCANGIINVYNPFSGDLKLSKDSNTLFLNGLAISPDGQIIAVSGIYPEIYLWKAKDLTPIITVKEKLSSVITSLSFSIPNGHLLIGSTDDEDIYFWKTNKGTFVKKLREVHEKNITSLDINNEGKILASADEDGKVKLWEIGYDQFSEYVSQGFNVTGAGSGSGFPPNLVVDLQFWEPSGNNILDALEQGKLVIKVKNSGEGTARKSAILLSGDYPSGLIIRNRTIIGSLDPGEEAIKEIPIIAGYSIPDYQISLTCKVLDEATGIAAVPMTLNFETVKYFVKLEDAGFQIEDANNDARIGPGEVVTVTVRVQNLGTSVAKNVRAKIRIGESVVFTEDNAMREKIYDLENLEPGEYKDEITFKIWANNSASDTLPVYLTLSELYGKWGVEDIPIELPFDSPDIAMKTLTVKGEKQSTGDIIADDFSIDIEHDIPQVSQRNSDALAIIFGIEKYKGVSNVTFAKRDAAFVKEYFSKTLGVPEARIYYKTDSDVGKAEFDKVFSKGGWLDKRVKEDLSDVYVYYSGHGAPDLSNNAAYLIPYDGDPNYASQTGYCIDDLYNNLSDLNARNVTIFLDACFSGANRENEMLLADARPVFIEAVKPDIAENITVFAAASAKQISSGWPEKKHGLFTYFMLKGLKGEADSDNNNMLTIQELSDYIKLNVPETAGMLDREQTPDIQTHSPTSILAIYNEPEIEQ